MSEETESVLVVLHPFGTYAKGDMISDKAVIAALLSGGRGAFVVATSRPVAAAEPASTLSRS